MKVLREAWHIDRRAVLAGAIVAPFANDLARAERPTVRLHIESDGDAMAFVPDRLTCTEGAPVQLFFHHSGKISTDPHNWVLLKPAAEKTFLADADRLPDDTLIIPPGDEDLVIAATPMCPQGKTVSTKFTAPAAGNYLFVCSVPGHGEIMRGTLTVTPYRGARI